jgi:hypothetical protein
MAYVARVAIAPAESVRARTYDPANHVREVNRSGES